MYRDILHWCIPARKTDLFPYLAAKYFSSDEERKSGEVVAADTSSLSAEEAAALRQLAKSFHRRDLLQEHMKADEEADKVIQEGSGSNSLLDLIQDLKTKSKAKKGSSDNGSAPSKVNDEDEIQRLTDSVESLSVGN